jgi:hypothetical protein
METTMRPVRETFATGGLFSMEAESLRGSPGSGRGYRSFGFNYLFSRIGNKSAPAAVYPRPGAFVTGITHHHQGDQPDDT